MASILQRATNSNQARNTEVYLIYGKPGTGKTTTAISFPKTKDKPMLYIDVMEGGSSVIPKADRDLVEVISISDFKELDLLFEEIMKGGYTDDQGQFVKKVYSTIVVDSLTQAEFLLKEYLKQAAGKDDMNLKLWGQAKDNNEFLFNTLRLINERTGSKVVAICHEKEMANEDNPDFNTLIPSLMTSSALSAAAKADYVWYTKVEEEETINPKTNTLEKHLKYVTFIDTAPYVLSKCRKPKEVTIKQKVADLTYSRFKKNVLDTL